MNNTIKNPFNEFREEQTKLNIFDYFVEPSYFDKICGTTPNMIYGSRGTGKTTILKALSISESKDIQNYLEKNNYIGIYFRVNLNITTSFNGQCVSEEKWEKLFSYYIAVKLSLELVSQFNSIKELIALNSEKIICEKYAKLFNRSEKITNLVDLGEKIYDELLTIRKFLNNCESDCFPQIGDYSTIISELPKDLLINSLNYDMNNKTVFYLIDEFEGLNKWQQEMIMSLIKYSDVYHTFKVCLRPGGNKNAKTRGGEYISETDDVVSIFLNNLIAEKKDEYYKYALDVCRKRLELYYKNNNLKYDNLIDVEKIFSGVSVDEEFKEIFKKKKNNIKDEIINFLNHIDFCKDEVKKYFMHNNFDFYIFKLLYLKNNKSNNIDDIYQCVIKKDDVYKKAVGNYKVACLYYLCYKFQLKKAYAGFGNLVSISGGTIRYLLELCGEIFERALANNEFNYNDTKSISEGTQTNSVVAVSKRRFDQISAIPQLGLSIRAFVLSIGKIYQIFHKDEKISKFEVNHFSIKASNEEQDENIKMFLEECVKMGVLIKRGNNKDKDSKFSDDDYIYLLHPIYTPYFKISWRKKQKTVFTIDEIKTFIEGNYDNCNQLIDKYRTKYNKSNLFTDDELIEGQISFDI